MRTRPLLAAPIVSLVLAAGLGVALAQDAKKVKLAEGDWPTYWKLHVARRAAALRNEKTFDREKREAIAKARAASFAGTGWTEQRLDEVESAVTKIASYLGQRARGGDEAEDARMALVDYDKTTIATVNGHLKEISDHEAEQKQVEELARSQERDETTAEKKAADRRASAAKAADGGLDARFLEGAWVQDAEATADSITRNVPEKARETMRARLLEAFAKSPPTITFASGGGYELKVERTGAAPTVTRGTWKLDGSKLTIKVEGKPDKETELERKDELLLMGKGKAVIVYKRKPPTK